MQIAHVFFSFLDLDNAVKRDETITIIAFQAVKHTTLAFAVTAAEARFTAVLPF